MGNRAVITTKENFEKNGIGVYLHWHGGRDSVEAFLKYCDLKGYRAPNDSYGWARLCQVIGNALGGTLSVGIDVVDRLDCDNYDNGVYIIDGWEIVDRVYHNGAEQNEYDLIEMLEAINESMPLEEQLDPDFFRAETNSTDKLEVGDTIYLYNHNGKITRETIIGIGENRVVNGQDVLGIPYVNRYGGNEPETNINNYLFESSYRIAK